jgi:hypothetical protein
MPDGGPSMMFQQVEQVFVHNCNGFPFGCHLGGSPGGGLSLMPGNAYANLVNVKASIAPSKTRVVPNDVANSFLWQKLHNTQGSSEGNPMPQGEGIQWRLLPQSDLDTIQNWIQAGAPD